MKNAIEIKELVKEYDSNFKLGEINLEIPSGCIIGLIGENGAGKTTLIKSILNIINTDNGSIKIFGKDNKTAEKIIKEDIGVVLDDMFFPEILVPKDINSILKKVYKNWDQELFYKYLNEFNIPLNKKIKLLSKGMRKKLELASAFAHHPKLLILDEPTSGLDPIMQQEFYKILKEEKDKGITIFYSTHILNEISKICDRVGIIKEGKLLEIEDIKTLCDKNLNYVTIASDEIDNIIKELNVEILFKNEDTIKFKNTILPDVLIKKLSKFKINNLLIEEATLEDIFMHYYN